MRIVYGVHGYGRGHAVRVAGVLPELVPRHEVCVLAGGQAVELLEPVHAVDQIPSLRYAYQGGRLSPRETLRANGPLLLDLVTRGVVSRAVEARMERFGPDVVVSDSEPFTLRAARRLGIPTIGFDHVGIISHCRPDAPPEAALQLWRDARLYEALLGRPDRAVVSSLYPAPPRHRHVRLVPPVLRRSVLEAAASEGEHLLVYFNQPHLLGPRVLRALGDAGVPVVVYGERSGRWGRLVFRRVGAERFVEDLATCRALVCTAGHQLASEAVHLGKAMLVAPEASAEQRLNARELARLGFAREVDPRAIEGRSISSFLGDLGAFRDALARAPRDGNARAVSALEATAAELRRGRHRPPSQVAVRPEA